MSNNSKSNAPDYKVHLVQTRGNGEEQWTPVGAAWVGRRGYINLDTVAGKVVLTPREELERMRKERQQQDRSPDREIGYEPKP